MSADKNEYEVLKGLLNGTQKNTLSGEVILSCVASKSKSDLGDASSVYVLHDPCDIRKPYASDMEDLGKVLSLEKQVINGYSSFNSVAVVPNNQEVHLLDSVVYSNRSADYVSNPKVVHIRNGQGKVGDVLQGQKTPITAQEYQLVQEDSYQNGTRIAFDQLTKSSKVLKESHPDRCLTHVLDREFDDEAIFKHIDELGDEFVIRLKLNRLSHQSEKTYTPTGRLSKKVKYKKLKDKPFAHQSEFVIDAFPHKGKIYPKAKALIEWESLRLGEKTYQVVRIHLSVGGKALFQHPMILLTNRSITTPKEAIQVYKTYILRFKIEVVFRFLKQQLGWESFQVRDFNSIRNLLALVFFLVGYFKELEEELKEHPLATFLCKLALSKGKVTIFYLLEGIEKLVIFQEVSRKMKENNITPEQVEEFLKEMQIARE
jgi:hypothetical protein